MTFINVLLLICIFIFSLDFDRPYTATINKLAHHPAAKLIAGILLVLLAYLDPITAILYLIVIFFWFADIHLVSSVL